MWEFARDKNKVKSNLLPMFAKLFKLLEGLVNVNKVILQSIKLQDGYQRKYLICTFLLSRPLAFVPMENIKITFYHFNGNPLVNIKRGLMGTKDTSYNSFFFNIHSKTKKQTKHKFITIPKTYKYVKYNLLLLKPSRY